MNDRIFQRYAIAVVLLAAALCAYAGQDNQAAITSNRQPAGEIVNKIDETEAGRPVLQRRNPRYQIGRGDVLDLNFPFVPDFNQSVTVQPDGYITLRGLGDLHVEGQTAPELTQSLRAAYSKILHEPVITVDLKDFEKPYFVAFGEVVKPGKYDLRGDTTVTQGLAIAGGLNDEAKRSQVLLFRRVSNDWTEVKKVNVKQLLQAQNLQEDLHLQPGDMLFVPKNLVGKMKRFIPTSSVGTYLRPTLP